MKDSEYIVIGSFVVGNIGTILGIFKWYLAKEVKLAERLVAIENDVHNIAYILGLERAIDERAKREALKAKSETPV